LCKLSPCTISLCSSVFLLLRYHGLYLFTFEKRVPFMCWGSVVWNLSILLLMQLIETVWTTMVGNHPEIIPVKFGQHPISGFRGCSFPHACCASWEPSHFSVEFNFLQLMFSACVAAVKCTTSLRIYIFHVLKVHGMYLFTFKNRVPLICLGASVVWNVSLIKTASIKTRLLFFSYRAVLPEVFPCFQLYLTYLSWCLVRVWQL